MFAGVRGGYMQETAVALTTVIVGGLRAGAASAARRARGAVLLTGCLEVVGGQRPDATRGRLVGTQIHMSGAHALAVVAWPQTESCRSTW